MLGEVLWQVGNHMTVSSLVLGHAAQVELCLDMRKPEFRVVAIEWREFHGNSLDIVQGELHVGVLQGNIVTVHTHYHEKVTEKMLFYHVRVTSVAFCLWTRSSVS